MEWRFSEAKNCFSDVVNRALSEGPQQITRHDDVVIVLSKKEYERLLGKQHGFKDYLLHQTPRIDDLEIERDKSIMRNVEL
jgi:prevent-host-death family protein